MQKKDITEDFIVSLPADVQRAVIYIGEQSEMAHQSGDADKSKAYAKGMLAIIDSYFEAYSEQGN